MVKGRCCIYGGQYVPETLMNAVGELARLFERWRSDQIFIDEYNFTKKITEVLEK